MKKKRYEAEGAKEYKKANKRIQKTVKKAKEDWMAAQCEETETCLEKRQKQNIISAGEGCNFRETGNRVDLQLSRIDLGQFLLKKKRFSAVGQNIVQNCT